MADQTSITIDIGAERDEVQQPQHPHQQQLWWLDSARKVHVLFGLLKLLLLPGSHSPYIICEVINLILLIAMMRSGCPHWVYWYLYIGSGTLGFELLLWMNLPVEAWLVINMCLLLYALESSGLLRRGSDQLLQLIQPLDDAPFSGVQFDV